MVTNGSLLLLITLWASMQIGFGLPMVKQLEAESAGSVPEQRERAKRCACMSRLDSECHYFCHLDIIWINTPSKTTLYGLGSSLSRRRRSTSRCSCANRDDHTCNNFCSRSPEITPTKKSVKRRQLDILNILRAVASQSKMALDAPDSEKAQRESAR